MIDINALQLMSVEELRNLSLGDVVYINDKEIQVEILEEEPGFVDVIQNMSISELKKIMLNHS